MRPSDGGCAPLTALAAVLLCLGWRGAALWLVARFAYYLITLRR